MADEEEKRLRPKYTVRRILTMEPNMRTEGGVAMIATDPDNIDSPFVLMPRKDPAAFRAMLTYAEFCEPRLSAEIYYWLRRISEAEPIYGTQGKRNNSSMLRDIIIKSRKLQGVSL